MGLINSITDRSSEQLRYKFEEGGKKLVIITPVFWGIYIIICIWPIMVHLYTSILVMFSDTGSHICA